MVFCLICLFSIRYLSKNNKICKSQKAYQDKISILFLFFQKIVKAVDKLVIRLFYYGFT